MVYQKEGNWSRSLEEKLVSADFSIASAAIIKAKGTMAVLFLLDEYKYDEDYTDSWVHSNGILLFGRAVIFVGCAFIPGRDPSLVLLLLFEPQC